MQTFLPYADFARSAQVLDYRRLGKQRVECLQILNALTGKSTGWVSHPVVKAWRGYESSLVVYALWVIEVWTARGYVDNCRLKILDTCSRVSSLPIDPPWLGDERVHSSYRSLLLYKDPEWYGQWGWVEKPVEKMDYRLMGVK